MLPIRFCFNDVSVDRSGHPVLGGQADRLAGPVIAHLDGVEWSIGPQPVENAVNIYYTHRGRFQKVRRETGVFVSHGIADKKWRDTTPPYYRATFVSGPAWTLRLLDHGAKPHTIFEVGYAKLDPLLTIRESRVKNRKPVVLWAPTHGGGGDAFKFATEAPPNTIYSQRSSWWHRTEILALLDDDRIEVIECPHPRHRVDGQATFDEYARADVVIGDGGSTIYEAWALGIPVVFCDWATRQGNMNGARGSFEEAIYEREIGWHASDPEQLVATVLAAAAAGITQAEADFIEPILPAAYRGVSGRLHAETLLDLAAGVAAPRHQPNVQFDSFVFAGRTLTAAVGTKQHGTLSRNRNWSLK